MEVLLYRGIGHPWTAAPGWDQLLLKADDLQALRTKVAEAESKYWRLWHCMEHAKTAHLYKPSGATAPWEDVRWQGTPRGHGHQFRVGDEVYTDFASTVQGKRITRHRITEIGYHHICQSGVVIRVDPPVPGSRYVNDAGRETGNPWIDAAWFRRVEIE